MTAIAGGLGDADLEGEFTGLAGFHHREGDLGQGVGEFGVGDAIALGMEPAGEGFRPVVDIGSGHRSNGNGRQLLNALLNEGGVFAGADVIRNQGRNRQLELFAEDIDQGRDLLIGQSTN